MHARFDAVRRVARHAQQLDRAAHLAGKADVGCSNARDALADHVREAHAGVEADGCHDGNLASRVVALNVRGRVRLGIAQLGRLCQRLVKLHAVLRHAGQDVVGGAVDNAHDLGQLVAGEALLERADDRDGAGHRRLKLEITVICLCEVEQLCAVLRDQIFVGGDNILARLKRLADVGACRLDAAHQLNHDLDIRIADNALPVVGQHRRVNARTRTGYIAHEYGGNLNVRADALRQLRTALFEQLIHAAADRAGAQQCDLNGLIHKKTPVYGYSL